MSGAAELQSKVFTAAELMPPAWQGLVAGGPVRTFNPGLLACGEDWVLAYRFVANDAVRRIGLCRLDAALRIVNGSHLPLSDELRVEGGDYPDVARSWFADPRLYRFGDRVFIYWNTGWHEPQNHQFLQELEATSLRPIGRARELKVRDFTRQKLEKNWTLFGSSAAEVFAVYSISPHRVLAGSLAGEGDVVFETVATEQLPLGPYPPCHGGLRGGAPPQWDGEAWLSFCHSVHDGDQGYRYAAAAYRFQVEVPFTPTHAPITPLSLHNPYGGRRVHPALNPAVGEVVYPCGAARVGNHWLISHGINDEHCAISVVSEAAVAATLRPLAREPSADR